MARITTVHHCATGQRYAPGAFESCIRCNPLTDERLAAELEYYFMRRPAKSEIDDYREWRFENPNIDTVEYVEAVQAL